MPMTIEQIIQILNESHLTPVELAHLQSILADRTLSILEKLPPETFQIPE
jgi:hypothetical protein